MKCKIIDNAMCNCKAYRSEILEIISYCKCCVLTYLSESFLGLLKNISLFVSSNFGMQWEKQKPALNKAQKWNENFGITVSGKKSINFRK